MMVGRIQEGKRGGGRDRDNLLQAKAPCDHESNDL